MFLHGSLLSKCLLVFAVWKLDCTIDDFWTEHAFSPNMNFEHAFLPNMHFLNGHVFQAFISNIEKH